MEHSFHVSKVSVKLLTFNVLVNTSTWCFMWFGNCTCSPRSSLFLLGQTLIRSWTCSVGDIIRDRHIKALHHILHYQSGSVRHRSHNAGKVRTFTDAQILQQSMAESLLILRYYSSVNIRSVRPSFRTTSTIWAILRLSDRGAKPSHCSQQVNVKSYLTGLNGGLYLIALVQNHPCTEWSCEDGAWSGKLSFRSKYKDLIN